MSKQFAIRRRIEIDAAHRVPDHGSKCFNLHGHRYVIEATLTGPIIGAGEQTGMVLDFGFLKDMMMLEIHEPCDHGTIFYRHDEVLRQQVYPKYEMNAMPPLGAHNKIKGWKLFIIDCVPTAENLARIWYELLDKAIHEMFGPWELGKPRAPTLAEVRVWETPNCVAWYPA